jgi:drug/metabolite transporter (DMT)-like permease
MARAGASSRDLVLIALIALLWGLNWPAVKIALDGVSPWTLRTIGLSFGAAALMGAARIVAVSLAIPRRSWGPLALAGLLGLAGFNIFAVFAQLALPTSRAAILTFTMPLWAALLSWWLLGERPTRARLAGLALGMAGLVVLSSSFFAVVAAGGSAIGLVYVLGAALTWAAGSVILKRAAIAASPLAITAWQLALAALVAALGTTLFETPRVDIGAPGIAWALAFHVLLPMSFCYLVWFDLIRRLPVSTVSLGTLLIPIFGVLGAVAILGERPTAADLAGFALILGGLGLDVLAARRSP